MISQSFLYNAIFFTYTLVLGKFYGVASEAAPLYLIAFAVGNLLGPLTIGHFFDTIGRKKMITGTYLLSGLLLALARSCSTQGCSTQSPRPLPGASSSISRRPGPARPTSP